MLADIDIVASTVSTLAEPSLENTLKSPVRFIFAFEEPGKTVRLLEEPRSTISNSASWAEA